MKENLTETKKMNLAEVMHYIRFYKNKGFSDEETKAHISGEKDLFAGNTELRPNKDGDYDLWRVNNGRFEMIPISRSEFFRLFYDDEFEVDEHTMNHIAREPGC